jgi:hypothetical protein
METSVGSETPLFAEQRQNIHKLLANNPNYFGTEPEADLPVVEPIKFNTTYEELTCVGLWPEKNLLEATIEVKLPFGFLGSTCLRGSFEYVRFFIDWNGDGNFVDFNEDAGVASVNVHDIPQVKEHHLCYAVRRTFKPFFANCKDPYIVKLRAILSWEIIPTGPNFIPIWGNTLECWIQVDPVEGKVIGVVATPKVEGAHDKHQSSGHSRAAGKERLEYLELIKKNPNYFGTIADSDLKPVFPQKFNTQYEELHCIGLYPEANCLEGIFEVKLPYGFMGDLCSPGSYEYVRFFIDWNGDGNFVDFNEDVGVVSVNVHDIPQVNQFHLCYALGESFHALRANCQRPYIVKVRAILSWQVPPTGPNFIPVWGNIKECWVQIRPTQQVPECVAVITSPADADPPNCVSVSTTATCGLAGVTITGSAGGSGFVSYRIEYRTLASPSWIQAGVVYPDCVPASVTPDNTTPRFAEPLAYLTNLEPDDYAVRLTVHGSCGTLQALTKFSLLRAPVVIDKIGQVDTRFVGLNPGCFLEPLKLVKLGASPTDPETSVGGSISIVGSADFWGCGQEMIQYALQYLVAPLGLGPSPVGPPPPPPLIIPPGTPPPCEGSAGPWSNVVPPLPFSVSDPAHPRSYYCWPANLSNVVLNGKLNRIWSTDSCVLNPVGPVYHSVRRTDEFPWNSLPLNGRYTVRLQVKHQDLPHLVVIQELYDAATVWLDNHDIQVKLTGLGVTGGAPLDACAELHLSQFLGKTADIKGRAWDPLILDTEPSWLKPNNNFDHYELVFEKDGAGIWVTNNIAIPDPTQRVPNTLPTLPPPPGDAGVLATWDIVTALDAGPMPPGPYVPPPYPKLYRGEFCAYLIQLYATDNTMVNDMATTHSHFDYWPFCIVNDLK